MIESIRKMWKIPELRRKIVYTFLMLLLFRLVSVVPAPGVDLPALKEMIAKGTASTGVFGLFSMMTGNAFEQMSIMAMGITPYINASIIMQLLTIAIPALERLSKEEDGRQKINRITRYVTVVLAALQAIGLVRALEVLDRSSWLNYALVGISMAGGTALAMWIGERITEKGIGNGISLLIFVGIISNITNGLVRAFGNGLMGAGLSAWVEVVVIIVTCIIMTVVVTFVELGERRIPLQIAKQVKGRRVYGGQSTHMSLKVVSVGVLPLIFAYSFLAFPGTIASMINSKGAFAVWWENNMTKGTQPMYLIVSALLIIAFTFFYSSISFDPKQQAEQLQQQGAVIPGQRGKNVRQYLQTIVSRLNLFAALFLAVLAAVPTLLLSLAGVSVPFAASSILIAVSVSLETIRTIQGEMSVRGIEMDMDNVGFM